MYSDPNKFDHPIYYGIACLKSTFVDAVYVQMYLFAAAVHEFIRIYELNFFFVKLSDKNIRIQLNAHSSLAYENTTCLFRLYVFAYCH